MKNVEVGDHILYTPFAGTDDEHGQHNVKVLELRERKMFVTDIFGNEFELSYSRIEDVNTPDDDHRLFFDSHIGLWKNK